MQSSTTIAKRYGKALFEAAGSSNALEQVEKDANSLVRLLEESSELRFTIHNRTYSASSLRYVFAEIAKNLDAHKLTLSFLNLLIENKRIGHLNNILSYFFTLMLKEKGELVATVTTARDISKHLLDNLAIILESRLNAKVNIETQIKPEILGGLVVEVDSFRFDASLKTKLSELQHTLERVA